jgi:hypothetical protein
LTQKIQRQDKASAKAPTTTGPSDMKTPPTVVWIPKAWPRCCSGKVLVMIAQEAGKITAAPMPCTARAVTNAPPLQASPDASDAPANTASPHTNAPRWPNLSARRPPIATKQVNVSR